MLQFGGSSLVLLFPSHPFFLSILWYLYEEHQLQLVLPSLSSSAIIIISSSSCSLFQVQLWSNLRHNYFISTIIIIISDVVVAASPMQVLVQRYQSVKLNALKKIKGNKNGFVGFKSWLLEKDCF